VRIALINNTSFPVEISPRLSRDDIAYWRRLMFHVRSHNRLFVGTLSSCWEEPTLDVLTEEGSRPLILPPHGTLFSVRVDLLELERLGGDSFWWNNKAIFRSDGASHMVEVWVEDNISARVQGVGKMHSYHLVSKPVRIELQAPVTEKERMALRLMDMIRPVPPHFVPDDIDRATAAIYGIIFDEKGVLRTPLAEAAKAIWDNFPNTYAGVEAAFWYADELSEQSPSRAARVYRWIIKKHPESWWAYLAQKALKELREKENQPVPQR